MDMRKILQTLDTTAKKPVQSSNDMKKFMTIVTEGTNRQTVAEQMIVQEYSKPEPKQQGNGIIKQYFNEVLKESEEQTLERKTRVQLAAKRVIARMEESKKEPPKPRNFVAKNAKTAGAGAHKDKKKAEKQGDVKHKGKELAEVSLGDYRKKAAVNKAVAQANKFFDRDNPEKVADADRTIAKRERGLGRADHRLDRTIKAMPKPTPVPVDKAKLQARLADLEREFDPHYEYSDDHRVWQHHSAINQQIRNIERQLRSVDEGIFDPETNPQIDQLKAMLADPKYANNPQWKAQLEKRLKKAQDRQDILGTMAADKTGQPIKVLPPDQYKGTLDEGDEDPCWADYKMVGTKKKGGKTVPNCVPKKKG